MSEGERVESHSQNSENDQANDHGPNLVFHVCSQISENDQANDNGPNLVFKRLMLQVIDVPRTQR